MTIWLASLAVFALAAGLVLGAYAGIARLPQALLRRRIESRMRGIDRQEPDRPAGDGIVRREVEGPLPAVDRLVARTARGSAMTRFIRQSGVRATVSSVILASLALAVLGGLGVQLAVHLPLAAAGGALLGLVVPFLFLRHRRSVRMSRFEEQFPEALDLLSRAIRAGHAFTTAMTMVADEAPDPIGPEFRTCFDQQNFGLPLKDALDALADRVPLLDVRFFVTGVLIQRETGGNLSEILDNLAHVIRERFKILRQVRVYTAHGRMTGYVLMALPAALAIVLSFINPEHMGLLFRERMGQMMVSAAILLQIAGYVWIRQVVKIEV